MLNTPVIYEDESFYEVGEDMLPILRTTDELTIEQRDYIVTCINEHERLKAENERLRKALEVYADEKSWGLPDDRDSRNLVMQGDRPAKNTWVLDKHGYELAQQALENK